MGNDRVSISLAALGRYRFVAQPDARRTNNPAERMNTKLHCNLYEKFVSYIHQVGEDKEKMSNVSSDPNYTDSTKSGIGAKAERVGDLRSEPPTNEATSRETASKMANLLEGLQFPATKEDIRKHIKRKSPAMGNRINDVFEAVQNNLEEGVSYNNVYDIELAAGLVEKKANT